MAGILGHLPRSLIEPRDTASRLRHDPFSSLVAGLVSGMRMILLYYESTVSEIDLPVLIFPEGFFR
jgi:hypothetical protein